MRDKHFYRIFGVTLECKEPLPGLIPFFPREDIPERKIFIGLKKKISLPRTRKGWNSFYGLDYWFDRQNRFAVIQSPHAGIFRIHFQKRRIEWKPVHKISLEFTQALLRVRIVGFLASHFMSSLLLHASVVVRQGIGIAFGGVISEGKSTLTASCLNDGFSLLSDDIAAVEKKKSRFLLHPGAPEFRLWPWTASRLNPQGVKGEYLAPEIKKKKFFLGRSTPWRFTNQVVPLRCLYLLARRARGGIRIEPLRGREALMGVLENSYNPMIKSPNVLRNHLEMAADLVQKVPVKRLIYPSGFSHLPRVRQAILDDLGSFQP